MPPFVVLSLAGLSLLTNIGAVLNTALLENKTWFIVLLVTGLLSFGFIAMVVYLIVGLTARWHGRSARSVRGSPSQHPDRV